MKYLLIGLLVSIGWYLGGVVVEIIEEVMLNRLHKARWYLILCKKGTENKKSKNRIGF